MALPVGDIMAPNSAIFMWATWPLIFGGPEALMKAWGFRYSGLAWTWIKLNPVTGKYAFGCGYGTRKNLEPCLLGLRGHPRLMSRSVRDFIIAPRREHSRKPDQQYDNVEAMYPGPHVELFARYPRPGWTQWGDQLDHTSAQGDQSHDDGLQDADSQHAHDDEAAICGCLRWSP
jgi:N6-adenosine-specific RNA methylase IME4